MSNEPSLTGVKSQGHR